MKKSHLVKKRLIEFRDSDLREPLTEGELVPCPKCSARHVVQRDPRPGTRVNTDTGSVTPIRNEALYVLCPLAPGPIVVGMDGRVLPEPLELTPRRQKP